VVLERRAVLGGAAVTEEPWPGYRVSSASYVVSLLPPRIVRELDLERHGYRVSIVTPDYFVPFPDGSGLTLWGDTARMRRRSRSSPRPTPARMWSLTGISPGWRIC
jgi:phytoene dehydrogenase-like protein